MHKNECLSQQSFKTQDYWSHSTCVCVQQYLPIFVGNVTIPGGITLTVDSDPNGDSPQFTFTCTSTGGPATTVTWTRNSEKISGGMTVLDDPVTAQYTHTLIGTGRLGGEYKCTVANNKPSTATASFIFKSGNKGIIKLMLYKYQYSETSLKQFNEE